MIVPAGAFIQMLLGALYAWSIFRLYLTKAFPTFTAAQMSMNFTLANAFYCLGGYIGGLLQKKFSSRRCLQSAGLLMLIGMICVSFMENLSPERALILLYIGYGVICGLGSGIGYNICLTSVSQSSSTRMGTISGILLMGYGAGSLLLGVVVQTLANFTTIFGVFRIMGIGICGLIFLASLFIPHYPVPKVKAAVMASAESDCSPRQMLKTRSFWLFFILCVTNSASGLLVLNSAANIAVWYGAAATVGLLVSLCDSFSRPVSGYLLDKFGILRTLFLLVALRTLASILMAATANGSTAVPICIGIFLTGACYGGCVTAGGKVVYDLYGAKHYPVNYSIATFCMLPGAFIGPLLSGFLQDSSGGAFGSTFVMMAVINLIALLLLWFLRIAIKKEGRRL